MFPLNLPNVLTVLRIMLVPVVVVALRWASAWALLPLLTAPVALVVVRATASREAPVLVRALKRTAVLEVWWAPVSYTHLTLPTN